MSNKPGLYYGYVVVACSVIIMMMGWGAYNSYGLFFESLLTEFGWTRALTSGVFSVSMFLSGLSGIISGRMSDRFGPKTVSIFCGFSLGVGFMLMSAVNSAWQVYLLYALPLSIGIGGLWPSMISTVARWFVKNRGLMTGITATGIGIGTAILPPVIGQFITAYGWRAAYIITGSLVLVVIVLSAQFLRRDPGEKGLSPYGGKVAGEISLPDVKGFTFQRAIHTRQFWMLAMIFILFGYNQVTIMVHVVPYATGLGIPHVAAANILAFIGASSILGRVIMGSMSDRIRLKPSLIIMLALSLASLTWLEFAGALWGLYLFSLTFGFAWGGLSSLQPLLSAELFGLTSLGTIVGSLAFSFAIGATVGPTVSGYIFDISASYNLAFVICAVTALAALVIALWLTPLQRDRETP